MSRNKFFIAAAVSYLITLGIIMSQINALQGIFTYVLDDTYIHLAMARNLALHGVYGINPHEFASASSAPLYTLFLAGLIRFFGDNQLIPLYINVISGGALLFVLSRFLPARPEKGGRALFIILALILPFILNLPALVFTGMEHLLHGVLISLAFLYVCRETGRLSGSAPGLRIVPAAGRVVFAGYCLLVLILPLARFESMFFLAPVFLIWLVLQRYREALATFLLPAAAVVIYGLINKSMGEWFFPNSVLLKSKVTSLTVAFVLEKITTGILINPLLLVFLFLFSLALYMFRGSRAALPALVYPVNAMLHLALAAIWYLGRYEAYLITLAAASLVYLYANFYGGRGLKRRWQLVALVLAMAFSLQGERNAYDTPLAANNIYEQQYQMAMLVKEYLNEKNTVFINDIGAVAYFGQSKVEDLVGLASFEVAQARRNRQDMGEFYAGLTAMQKPDLIIVYESWFPGVIPPQWHKVATWTITRELITPADKTVTFYLLKEKLPLKEKIAAYSREKLPKDVEVRFFE